jgi:hypothetical protein
MFGEENINFEILTYTYNYESIEISLLIQLSDFRIIGDCGRKSDWLGNISIDKIKEISFDVIENEYGFIANKYVESSYYKDETLVTSNNLLELFLELTSLSPNYYQWKFIDFLKNPPRYFRFLQLITIMDFYDIEYESFLNGEFIKENQKAIDFLSLEFTDFIEEGFNYENIQQSFSTLLQYRISIEKILRHNDGVYCSSGGYTVANQISNEINKSIRNSIIKMDNFLSVCISDKNKSISIKDLKEKYFYPNVDLVEVDWAYW